MSHHGFKIMLALNSPQSASNKRLLSQSPDRFMEIVSLWRVNLHRVVEPKATLRETGLVDYFRGVLQL